MGEFTVLPIQNWRQKKKKKKIMGKQLGGLHNWLWKAEVTKYLCGILIFYITSSFFGQLRPKGPLIGRSGSNLGITYIIFRA